MNISKYLLLGVACLAAQGLYAQGNGGYRNEADTYISPDGFYYDRSNKDYVIEEHAEMERAEHRADYAKYPSITTYSPDYNPQNAYKDLPAYRGDRGNGNYAPQSQPYPQQQSQSCPSGRCPYQRYQNSNTSYQQQYPQATSQQQYPQANQGQMRSENAMNGDQNKFRTSTSDNDIAQNIRSEISNDNTLSHDAKMVQVDVKNGKVTLSGSVQNNGEKNKIDDLVHQTDGVTSVSNNITVNTR